MSLDDIYQSEEPYIVKIKDLELKIAPLSGQDITSMMESVADPKNPEGLDRKKWERLLLDKAIISPKINWDRPVKPGYYIGILAAVREALGLLDSEDLNRFLPDE